MHSFTSLLVASAALFTAVRSHTVITYPGWRGNNLIANGTMENEDWPIPPGSLAVDTDENGTTIFPYGMQWVYPCGGMPTSRNRTKWPVGGGSIGLQPGWFPGHSQAQIYINLGLGNEPRNMSHPMLPVFEISGPSNQMYPGSICLTQVPLPANVTVNVGDNATIQVIELAQHGAALYNCVDITFANPEDVAQVNETNCKNTTEPGSEINFGFIYYTSDNAAAGLATASIFWTIAPTVAALAAVIFAL